MGYSTTFSGRINLSRTLTYQEHESIRTFSEARHNKDDDDANRGIACPTYWCDLTINVDGTALVWNGNEKSYDMGEWTKIVIDNLLPKDVIANGTLNASGEEAGDIWRIVVVDNVVKVERATISYGDSYGDYEHPTTEWVDKRTR
jgi:hypothetical protein